MTMRHDAGVAAARNIAFVDDLARTTQGAVATVGTIRFEPNAINIIPSSAFFTVDMRSTDEGRMQQQEAALTNFLQKLSSEGFAVSTGCIALFEPVTFASHMVETIETAAAE